MVWYILHRSNERKAMKAFPSAGLGDTMQWLTPLVWSAFQYLDKSNMKGAYQCAR